MSARDPDDSSRTSAQVLRDDIDKGRTGSKVAFEDPAAAPLGTDDEAGGNTPGPAQVDLARRQERFDHPSDMTTPPQDAGAAVRHGAIWTVAIVAVVGAALAIMLL